MRPLHCVSDGLVIACRSSCSSLLECCVHFGMDSGVAARHQPAVPLISPRCISPVTQVAPAHVTQTRKQQKVYFFHTRAPRHNTKAQPGALESACSIDVKNGVFVAFLCQVGWLRDCRRLDTIPDSCFFTTSCDPHFNATHRKSEPVLQ